MACSPPGFSVYEISVKNTGVGCHFLLQYMKWKVKVKSLSHVWPLATPWTAAHQAPLSMGFSRQEYWSGVPLTGNALTKTYYTAFVKHWVLPLPRNELQKENNQFFLFLYSKCPSSPRRKEEEKHILLYRHHLKLARGQQHVHQSQRSPKQSGLDALLQGKPDRTQTPATDWITFIRTNKWHRHLYFDNCFSSCILLNPICGINWTTKQ